MLKVAPQACSIGLTWELVQKADSGTSLVAQWLGRCTSTAGGMGSTPDGGTKILQALWAGQKKERNSDSLTQPRPTKSGPGLPLSPQVICIHIKL